MLALLAPTPPLKFVAQFPDIAAQFVNIVAIKVEIGSLVIIGTIRRIKLAEVPVQLLELVEREIVKAHLL